MTGQSETANLRSASVQHMEQDSLAPFHANRLSVVQHPAIDRKGTVADFVSMRHTLRERSLHGRLAFFFQRLHFRRWREEVHRHVSASTEGGLEFLQHEKDLAVIVTWLMLWLNVHCADLAAILTGNQVRSCAVVRVIETKTGWPWRECDPALSMSGNEGSTFFSGSVHVDRHHLAMPMQLLRKHRFVVDVYDRLLSFFKPEQWSGKLSVV